MNYGLVKTYTYEDVNENGEIVKKTITLEFNPLTLIKYHGYVGRDLLADATEVVRRAGKTNISGETEIGEMTDGDVDALNGASASIEFFANLVAAMICTARRNERLNFEDVIASIPFEMLTDSEFMNEITEFFTFGIKKK